MEQGGCRRVSVSGSADPAKHTISCDGFGVALADHFVADPEDQNPHKKQGEIETHKPGKRDRNHGFAAVGVGVEDAACAPQSMRTRPQPARSEG